MSSALYNVDICTASSSSSDLTLPSLKSPVTVNTYHPSNHNNSSEVRRMAAKRQLKSRQGGYLIAIIGDEDTATGFLLAGVGDNQPSHGSNYFVVDPKDTPVQAIEEAFKNFTEREDIAIILINQYIADKIRSAVSKFSAPVPAILEIPSKEHPYDPSKDSILQRVRGMLGNA